MNYNLVLHVDLNEVQRLNIAFDNVANYLTWLDDHPEAGEVSIVLVANGPAVQLFTNTPEHTVLMARGQELMREGLSIRLCKNALRKFEITPDMLWEGCVVTVAIPEFVQLHNAGYTYIKP